MVNVMLTIVAQNQIFYSHTTVLLFVLLFLKLLFVKCSFKALNISSKVIYCSLLEVVLNRL